MTEVESRRIAHIAAKDCRKYIGMSPEEFRLVALDEESVFFQYRQKTALKQLAMRGELDHLIEWVWTFKRVW